MKNSFAEKNENKQVIDNVLDLLRTRGLQPINFVSLVGALLYLNKENIKIAYDYKQETIGEKSVPIQHIEYLSEDFYNLPLDTLVQRILSRHLSFMGNGILEDIIIPIINADIAQSEFATLYNYFMDKVIDPKYFSLCPMPAELSTLCDELNGGTNKNVFIPFGGIMNTAIGLTCYNHLDTCEKNTAYWEIGIFRLALADKLTSVNFMNCNIDGWTDKVYDTIISFPPFSAKIEMHDKYALAEELKNEDSELIAGRRFFESTTPDGVCISFMPTSALYKAGSYKRFRKWVLDTNCLDAIIILPQNMLDNTNIPLTCIVMKKNTSGNDSVKIVDASNFYNRIANKNVLDVDKVVKAYQSDMKDISASISYDVIKENDCSWNVNEYLQHENIDVPEGSNVARLEEIVTVIGNIRDDVHKTGRAINISNLSDDWTNPVIDVTNIEESSNLQGMSMVTQDAIIVSTIRSLKPSIVSASKEKPIWINQHMIALTPKKDIDMEYLCMSLSKVQIPTYGASIPYITKSTILRQKIVYPDIRVQKAVYKESRYNELLSRAKEAGLQEVIDKMKADYINEVRSRKHDMMPHLRQISSARKNLEYYLSHRDEFSDSQFIVGMSEEVQNQANAIKALSDILAIFSRESQFGESEVINIYDYFVHNYFDRNDYIVDFIPDNVALLNYDFHTSGENYDPDKIGGYRIMSHEWQYFTNTNILMAKDDLERLCQNIMNNAITHGFTDPSKPHCIEILLTVDQEQNMFQIDFTNDGNPLPKGMDKLRYGLRGEKAGSTGGTGEGGYIVRTIAEHYGGNYDIFCEKSGGEYYTTVRILLPIHRDNEQ